MLNCKPVLKYLTSLFVAVAMVFVLPFGFAYSQTDTANEDSTSGFQIIDDTNTGPRLRSTNEAVESSDSTSQTGANRSDRLESLRADKEARMEELKAEREQKMVERQEAFQEKLDIAQARRLEMIANRADLVVARYTKAVSHLYSVLERLETYLETRNSSGFATQDYSAEMDAAEAKLAAVETEIATFEAIADGLVDIETVDDARAIVEQLKSQSDVINAGLQEVRNDISSLVETIRSGGR